MLGKLARSAFLAVLVLMIVSWAMSMARSGAFEPPDEQAYGRMYC